MRSHFEIRNRRIGRGEPAYIIAEMSANHGGSFDSAADVVRAAALPAGADAVKLQTYTRRHARPSQRPTESSGSAAARSGTAARCTISTGGVHPLGVAAEDSSRRRRSRHCTCSARRSTPRPWISSKALDVPAYKVASFELVDLPLMEQIARTGKPIIMSTGMATLAEIGEAVATSARAGAQLRPAKCTSATRITGRDEPADDPAI